MLIYAGCTPVGCVLIQILKVWKAHVTATCFKRAVPVAKALGTNDVIVLPDTETDVLETLEKELTLRDKFDVIISTKEIDFNFYRYCSRDNVTCTFPKPLATDQFGIVLKTIYSIYVNVKCISQVLI